MTKQANVQATAQVGPPASVVADGWDPAPPAEDLYTELIDGGTFRFSVVEDPANPSSFDGTFAADGSASGSLGRFTFAQGAGEDATCTGSWTATRQ